MRISFVIPAYNEEQLLPKCLEAVKREIAHTPLIETEVIVVNNASTDRTGELARSYDWVRVVDEPRKGLVRARQAGYVVSTGELIANVDSDAMVGEGWLETVRVEFEKDPRLVALSGPQIYYDLSWPRRAVARVWYIVAYWIHIINHYIFHTGAILQGGNFVVRRSAMEQIGGFDTSIEFYGEDADVAKRISKVGEVKWTFALPTYASGRRLAHEGTVITGLRYMGNFFYVLLRGKPYTTAYTDIREVK